MPRYDIAIIGCGIGGASLAAQLAARHSVLVLERESAPGTHATGRSAAIYAEAYGNAAVRGLTAASGRFYAEPPEGFAAVALWQPIDVFMIGTAAQAGRVRELHREASGEAGGISLVDGARWEACLPIARRGAVALALLDTGARALDVDAILQGFVRRAKSLGAIFLTETAAGAIRREAGGWRIETPKDSFEAATLVNAAGAWADQVAERAGVGALGLTPLRRSACVVDPAGEGIARDWPMTVDIDERFYFRPESGGLLVSPADETPSPPCDAHPEDIDIATGIDRAQQIIDLQVRRVRRSWAGLRTFAPDRTPVVGFDPRAEGFFWFAGQGGYGIQTAPAMAALGAALLEGGPLPEELAARGVRAEPLSPRRLPAAAGAATPAPVTGVMR